MNRLGLPLGARTFGGVVFVSTSTTFAPSPFVTPEHAEHYTNYAPAREFIRTEVLAPAESVQRLPVRRHGLEDGRRVVTPTPRPLGVDGAVSGAVHSPQLRRRGFNMLSAVWNPEHARFHHPSQLWAPGDFVVHVTSSPRFQELYRQFVDPLLWIGTGNDSYGDGAAVGNSTSSWGTSGLGTADASVTRSVSGPGPQRQPDCGLPVGADAPASAAPRCGGVPCPEHLWAVGADGNLAFRYLNRWSGYVPEAPMTECVPLHALVKQGPGNGGIVTLPHPPRMYVPQAFVCVCLCVCLCVCV